MKRIEVVRETDGGFNRAVWDFWYFDSRHALVLDGYRTEFRASKRHKFKVSMIYNRLNSRASSIQEGSVPMPLDVMEEAKEKFTASLLVGMWCALR